jgi:hypothetical protein
MGLFKKRARLRPENYQTINGAAGGNPAAPIICLFLKQANDVLCIFKKTNKRNAQRKKGDRYTHAHIRKDAI